MFYLAAHTPSAENEPFRDVRPYFKSEDDWGPKQSQTQGWMASPPNTGLGSKSAKIERMNLHCTENTCTHAHVHNSKMMVEQLPGSNNAHERQRVGLQRVGTRYIGGRTAITGAARSETPRFQTLYRTTARHAWPPSPPLARSWGGGGGGGGGLKGPGREFFPWLSSSSFANSREGCMGWGGVGQQMST